MWICTVTPLSSFDIDGEVLVGAVTLNLMCKINQIICDQTIWCHVNREKSDGSYLNSFFISYPTFIFTVKTFSNNQYGLFSTDEVQDEWWRHGCVHDHRCPYPCSVPLGLFNPNNLSNLSQFTIYNLSFVPIYDMVLCGCMVNEDWFVVGCKGLFFRLLVNGCFRALSVSFQCSSI